MKYSPDLQSVAVNDRFEIIKIKIVPMLVHTVVFMMLKANFFELKSGRKERSIFVDN